MTTYSSDGRFPKYRLVGEDSGTLESTWNRLIREHGLPFRQFHVGAHSTIGSRCGWMHRYLRQNASAFGHSKWADPEDIYESFRLILVLAMAKLAELSPEQAEGIFQRPVNARLTVWKAIDPPQAIVALSGFAEAHRQDEQRRQEKAAALRRWDAAWKEARRKAVLLISDPEKLDALLPQVIEHLASIEALIEQTADR